MPEQTMFTADLKTAIDLLEDDTLDVSRGQNYQIVQNALDSGGDLSLTMIERLLAVCVHDLKKEMKYAVINLNIISAILRKVKAGEFSPKPDLVPSAETVLKVIKTTAMENVKLETLHCLCFNTFLSYPDDTLQALEASHSTEIIEVIDICSNKDTPYKIRVQPIDLIFRLLKILPPDRKAEFVKSGTSIWFSRVIPTVISHLITVINKHETLTHKCMDVLEMLTDELGNFDYTDNIQWKTTLAYISDPKKYPSVMKSLMQNGSAHWHSLWIVFIRLLKHQLTIYRNKHGSTINSLLSVVEFAFKSNVTDRCRAFQCWNILIDVFSTMTNDVDKKIQLLIIPLISDNAKVEETAFAKQNTWWHLIRQYQNKMDKHVHKILIPFLVHCFGKHALADKSVPGLISDSVKKQSVQMFIEILGHADCDGCVNIPKLNKKLITTVLLVDHWEHWLHYLMTATKVSLSSNIDITSEQVACMWMSYLAVIAELPDNAIRKDLFNDLLKTLQQLVQESAENDNLLLSVISSFFDKKGDLKHLLKTKDDRGSIYKLIFIVMDSRICSFYHRLGFEESVNRLKLLTDVIMDQTLCSPNLIIKWILKEFPPNNNTLMLWTALVESISESSFRVNISLENLSNLMLWPLKVTTLYSLKPALAWHKLYNLYPSLNKSLLNRDISNIILPCNGEYSTVFTLCVLLAVLKNQLLKDCKTEYEKVAKWLQEVITKIESYGDIEEIFPILMDTLMLMIDHSIQKTNLSFGQFTVSIVKHVLKLTNKVFKMKTDNVNHMVIFIEKLLKSVHTLFKIETYSVYGSILLNELIECSTFTDKERLIENVTPILKTFLLKENGYHEIIETAINTVEKGVNNNKKSTYPEVAQGEKIKFCTPKSNLVTKKVNKKGASIVNIAVENGEEYVVVKSNWKFNPRKLTENQKEKLQRKNEDIPALYQDLSQSQDEIKLLTWKADSQDTSTGSVSDSKPVNEDIKSILKNLPSSEIVPNIMENILSDKEKRNTNENRKDDSDVNKSNDKQLSTPKQTKTQRIALKDRVFRNVRNLMEKSNLLTESNTDSLNHTVNNNVPKTPTNSAQKKKSQDTCLVNSAPPKISSERPIRAKKIPRKFEDVKLIPLQKKRNRSVSQTDREKTPKASEDTTEKLDNMNKNVAGDIKSVKNDVQHKESSNTEITSEEKNTDPDGKLHVHTEMEKLQENIGNTTNKIVEKPDTDLKTDSNKDSICINENVNDINSNEYIVEDEIKMSTPNITSKHQDIVKKSSSKKKSSVKASRLEKELAIDTVEGHPLLKATLSNRTRRCLTDSPKITRRRLTNKLDTKTIAKKRDKDETNLKISKDKSPKNKISSVSSSINTEDNINSSPVELPMSEDVIESSQDSTLTTMSTIRSIKNTHKVPLVILHNIGKSPTKNNTEKTQDILDDTQTFFSVVTTAREQNSNSNDKFPQNNFDKPLEQESKDDIELSRNKTVTQDKTEEKLTEDMDTEPIAKQYSSEAIVIDDEETTIEVTDETVVKSDTQEVADANTQPMDSETIADITASDISGSKKDNKDIDSISENNQTCSATADDITKNISESIDVSSVKETETDAVSSSFKGDNQRKKEFLNDTLEISPIKTVSPIREDKSPSPETSNDYVVIKLSSPVQSNGEPFEKCDSPEIFTNDKISPDKRDQSPPRQEFTLNNTSPSSLSLKKNRPQMRGGSRAAQILVLCGRDRLKILKNSEKSDEAEETKKINRINNPVRRNLRIYNAVGENNENEDHNQCDIESFLRLKRAVPAADCSPSVPILKRKLSDVDDSTASPASKRKRVSFHDPPVSTTVSVQKYIEPCGIQSPQNSAKKRHERQQRIYTTLRSQKKLENVFKLDSALGQTLDSFSDVPNDEDMSSLEQTPPAEIVKTTDLNNTDPICADLINCSDPIENIATELSSPTMRALLIKELEGNIETVGDLAKMTELEVNRLCIKAPKVLVAKKVLLNYVSKQASKSNEQLYKSGEVQSEEKVIPITGDISNKPQQDDITESAMCIEDEPVIEKADVEIQTNVLESIDFEMQTVSSTVTMESTQTDVTPTANTSVQTIESGTKSTLDIIKWCLSERPDFVKHLSELLDESSKREIANTLPHTTRLDDLIKNMIPSESETVQIQSKDLIVLFAQFTKSFTKLMFDATKA